MRAGGDSGGVLGSQGGPCRCFAPELALGKYLEDNLGAIHVQLTPEELGQIDAIFPPGSASGERYPAQAMQSIDK